MKDEDTPGLAMTRSFGDRVACKCGVTVEPEVLEFDLSPQDCFIVLASDGVWDQMSNEEVGNIVMPYYEQRNAEKAAEQLVRAAFQKWKDKASDIVDDITCVVIFLEPKLPQ